MRKLLALDLDGTTVNRKGQLGERTKQALQAARDQGHWVCFATGRRDVDMFPFWNQIKHADYLLLNNGGKLLRASDREVLFNHCIEPEIARELIELCLAENWQLHVTSGNYWGINKWNESLQSYIDYLGTEPVRYDSLEQTPWRQVEGFMATVDREEICAYIDSRGLALSHTPSEEDCTDIMAKDISKWNGLLQLMRLLEISSEQVVAAGDYSNDLAMILGAGTGVAVANALDAVKAAADYVTQRDCDHDPVAEIVERFLL